MLWQLLGLGVVLALNNAMAAMALGSESMGRLRQLRIASVFAGFEAVMPVMGVLIGRALATAVGGRAHVIGVVILAATGLYSLLKRDNDAKDEAAASAATATDSAEIASSATVSSAASASAPVIASDLTSQRKVDLSTRSEPFIAAEDGKSRRGARLSRQSMKTLFYAIVLSLDNLAVGFSLGLFSVPVGMAALVFGSVSLVLTFIGLEVGRLLRRRMTLSADRFAGAILLATACVMLFV